MWVAEMETEHFRWRAAGHDERAALAALATAWNVHRGQMATRDDIGDMLTAAEAIEYYEPRTWEAHSGLATRDDSPLVDPAPDAEDPRCIACAGHGVDMGLPPLLQTATDALDYLANDTAERARKESDTDKHAAQLYAEAERYAHTADAFRALLAGQPIPTTQEA